MPFNDKNNNIKDHVLQFPLIMFGLLKYISFFTKCTGFNTSSYCIDKRMKIKVR